MQPNLNAICDGKIELNPGALDCKSDLVSPVTVEIFYNLAAKIELKLIQMADDPRGIQAQRLSEAEVRNFVRRRHVSIVIVLNADRSDQHLLERPKIEKSLRVSPKRLDRQPLGSGTNGLLAPRRSDKHQTKNKLRDRRRAGVEKTAKQCHCNGYATVLEHLS